ncbi:MAG: hypothetical protein ACKO0Z_07205 [Betaproteobacteria bacterium]
MAKRNEPLVKVKDLNGEIFEVSRRNGLDLVQNLGWKYVREVEDLTNDEKATSPRQRIPRGQKLADSRKLASEQKALAKEPPATKKRGKKAETVIVDEVEEVVNDDAVGTFDESEAALDLNDELAELEAEEGERGNH